MWRRRIDVDYVKLFLTIIYFYIYYFSRYYILRYYTSFQTDEGRPAVDQSGLEWISWWSSVVFKRVCLFTCNLNALIMFFSNSCETNKSPVSSQLLFETTVSQFVCMEALAPQVMLWTLHLSKTCLGTYSKSKTQICPQISQHPTWLLFWGLQVGLQDIYSNFTSKDIISNTDSPILDSINVLN